MYYLLTDDHSFDNELAALIRAFYPLSKVESIDKIPEMSSEKIVYSYSYIIDDSECNVSFRRLTDDTDEIKEKNFILKSDIQLLRKRQIKNIIKTFLYEFLTIESGQTLKWGVLTGVRPVLLMRRIINEYSISDEAKRQMFKFYAVSKEKLELLWDTATAQLPIIKDNSDDMISIYINIPFCPSKCHYCSFPSDIIGNCSGDIKSYLDSLEREIMLMQSRLSHFKVQSLYIGGGTPTSLCDNDFKRLMNIIADNFMSYNPIEFTLEAGRPDTLNEYKFDIMREAGVTRISINPQSMNDKTLELIGRNHSVDEIIKMYKLAREKGFDNINMDIIAGLPGETLTDFENTLNAVCDLNPDGITVHTLSIKRASVLKDDASKFTFCSADEVEEMVNAARERMYSLDYNPYYLYRQKYMFGNMENVGYAKSGSESIYNIQMMEEVQSIMAFGAGSISKCIFPKKIKIERAPNVKNHKVYIERLDEMANRKIKLFDKLIEYIN